MAATSSVQNRVSCSVQSLTLSVLYFLLFCNSSSKHSLTSSSLKMGARILCSHLQSFLEIQISCPSFRLSPYNTICHAHREDGSLPLFGGPGNPENTQQPEQKATFHMQNRGQGGSKKNSFIAVIISQLASSSSSLPEKHRLLKLKGRQQTREQYLK